MQQLTISLTEELVSKLNDTGLTFNHFVAFMSIYQNNTLHTLYKKGFDQEIRDLESNLFLKDGKPTDVACKFFNLVPYDAQIKDVLKHYNDKFEEFWNLYPSSDKYGSFPRSRVLRSDKPRARKYFTRICFGEGLNPDVLIACLKEDIELKKKSSGFENKFKYMQMICSWLNKRIFEAYLEDVASKNISKPSNTPKYGEELD